MMLINYGCRFGVFRSGDVGARAWVRLRYGDYADNFWRASYLWGNKRDCLGTFGSKISKLILLERPTGGGC